ncbi:MAG: sulfite exporter TauE/SafE family protein [Leptospirales bacterium]|nr:sulfite exporter TauE/SafE family protein [Leptospirales bacterium]
MIDTIYLIVAGVLSGILAGLLGVGGGALIVPVLVLLGRSPHIAIGTSSLAMVITSISGSFQNWRTGGLDRARVVPLGIFAVAGAQIGAVVANMLSARVLEVSFACLLIASLYLTYLRRKLAEQTNDSEERGSLFLRCFTGLCGGLLSGLFGVGGGVIMVPMQMLLLGESLKMSIRVSLAVIIFTALSAAIGHSFHGNVNIADALILGLGGLAGAQIGTRFLPKLPEKAIVVLFVTLSLLLAITLLLGLRH